MTLQGSLVPYHILVAGVVCVVMPGVGPAAQVSRRLWRHVTSLWQVGGVCLFDDAWRCHSGRAAALTRAAPHIPCGGAMSHTFNVAVRLWYLPEVEWGREERADEGILCCMPLCVSSSNTCMTVSFTDSGATSRSVQAPVTTSRLWSVLWGQAPSCVPLGLLFVTCRVSDVGALYIAAGLVTGQWMSVVSLQPAVHDCRRCSDHQPDTICAHCAPVLLPQCVVPRPVWSGHLVLHVA